MDDLTSRQFVGKLLIPLERYDWSAAVSNAADAKRTWLEAAITEGIFIPEPSEPNDKTVNQQHT